MELNKENLQFDTILKRNFNVNVSVKELVEEDTKLLSLTANACCGRCEMLNNEVVIEGVVKYCAVIKNDNIIKKIERNERFNVTETISGMKPDSKMLATAVAERVRGYVEAGNLMLSCNVNINALIVTSKDCSYIEDLESDEFRKRSQMVSMFKTSLIKPLRFSITENTELSPRVPEINSILSVDAFAEIKEVHISAGQLIIGGDVFLQTVYNSTDEYEPIIQVSDRFDFSQLIELNEIDSGKPMAILNVEDVNTNISMNEQGEMRVITYNIGLNGYAYGGKNIQCEIINDAYSIKNKTECVKNDVKFTSLGEEFDYSFSKSINVPVPDGCNPISRINSVTFVPEINLCEIKDSNVFLKCSGEVGVIYTASASGETEGFNTTVNFDVFVENSVFNDADESIFNIQLNDMQAVLLSGNEVEIRAGMNIKFIPEYSLECQVLENIMEEDDSDFPEFGIIIYNVQRGDTLWEICKKYGVDEEEIKRLNHDLTDLPEAGRKIYIFRRLAV